MAPSAESTPFRGIYAIRHIASGKLYIGSAVDIGVRWAKHRRQLRSGTHHCRHLGNAWNRDGEGAFVFEVLEFIADKSTLIPAEQRYLDHFRSWDRANGYNSSPTAGSCLGSKHSDEAKAANSRRQKGKKRPPFSAEWLANMSAANKGKKPSPEAIAKQAAAVRGRKKPPRTAEHRARISAANKGRKRPPEIVALVAAKVRGQKRSIETRIRVSEAIRKAKRRKPDPSQQQFGFTSCEEPTI